MLLNLIKTIEPVVNTPTVIHNTDPSYKAAAALHSYRTVPLIIIDDVLFGGYSEAIIRKPEFVSAINGLPIPPPAKRFTF